MAQVSLYPTYYEIPILSLFRREGEAVFSSLIYKVFGLCLILFLSNSNDQAMLFY